jgi:hypothetical protein
MNTELFQNCYFCEHRCYANDKFFIDEHNGIWICQVGCYECVFNCLVNISENIECPVCLETKKGIKLPNCNHIICIDCCKYIYCGFCNTPKPLILYHSEFNENEPFNPEWPYAMQKDSDGEIDYENDEKLTEYEELENIYYNNYKNKTYYEIIKIRDELIETRPSWMNTEEFITWENQHMRHWIYVTKKDINEEEYHKSKQTNINNRCCPLCRK